MDSWDNAHIVITYATWAELQRIAKGLIIYRQISSVVNNMIAKQMASDADCVIIMLLKIFYHNN
jgi:hypothetical protein